MDFGTIRRVILGLHERNPLRLVVFAGGEPTVARDVLSQSIQLCYGLGIRTRLVTNAFWAISEAAARKYLILLKADGLTEINVSSDDYHLPFVPIQNVVNAWNSAKELSFESVVVANGSGPENKINPGYLSVLLGKDLTTQESEKGMHIMTEFPSRKGTYFAISQTKLQRLKRAKDSLLDADFVLYEDSSMLQGGCPHVMRNAALSPQGHLLACCGFETEGNAVLDLGRINTQSTENLISAANRNDILTGLFHLGPYFLLMKAREIMGMSEEERKFSALCEVCQELTEQGIYLEALHNAPQNWLPQLREKQKNAGDVTP